MRPKRVSGLLRIVLASLREIRGALRGLHDLFGGEDAGAQVDGVFEDAGGGFGEGIGELHATDAAHSEQRVHQRRQLGVVDALDGVHVVGASQRLHRRLHVLLLHGERVEEGRGDGLYGQVQLHWRQSRVVELSARVDVERVRESDAESLELVGGREEPERQLCVGGLDLHDLVGLRGGWRDARAFAHLAPLFLAEGQPGGEVGAALHVAAWERRGLWRDWIGSGIGDLIVFLIVMIVIDIIDIIVIIIDIIVIIIDIIDIITIITIIITITPRCHLEEVADAPLAVERPARPHDLAEPVGVLHAGDGVVNALESGRNGDDLADSSGEAVDIVVPVDEVADVEVGDAAVARPLAQEVVADLRVGVEDGGGDGALGHREPRREARDDHRAGSSRRLRGEAPRTPPAPSRRPGTLRAAWRW